MADAVETTVTFLEMTAPRFHHVAKPALKLMLMRAEQPTVGFYRYLYDAVGAPYHWLDRKRLSDDALRAQIHADTTAIWVLHVAGSPAGYFEVDTANAQEPVLAYFGIIPDYHGRGLGKWLLAEAVRTLWEGNPKRVLVETCTLDGPAALPLYQKLGFTPYAQKKKLFSLVV